MKPERSKSPSADGLLVTLQMVALWNLAVAQPVYDLLGANVEFFSIRGAKSVDVVLWMVVLSVLAPLLLAAVTVAVGALHRTLGRILHPCLVTLLTTLLVLVAIRPLGWATVASLAVAVLVGIVVTFVQARYRPVRQHVAILAAGAVVFPLLFVARSSVLRATSRGPIDTVEVPVVNQSISVVMIVFDELSTVSLLDENRKIDPVRYSNLARLADESIWYRHAATVSEFTTTAVPAIMTGNYPKPGLQPTAVDHPFNLFTLLGPSVDLSVVESLSRLCPDNLCGDSSESLSRRLPSLFSDTSIVYLHLALPESWRRLLPPVDQTWMEFGATERLDRIEQEERTGDAYWLDVFRDRAYGNRAAHLLEYLKGLRTDNERHLYYYNSLLPHMPFDYLPSGRLYSANRETLGMVVEDQWGGDEWAVTQSYQRHLLQVGFVDRQVGQIVRWLRDAGLYDSSLLIVTADHGSSYRPLDSHRRMTATNYADIISVPLLIKLPGQQDGRIDDRVAQTIDILPTIADVLDIDLPWTVDGVSLLGAPNGGKTDYLVYHLNEDVPVSLTAEHVRQGMVRALERKLSLFGSGSDPEERFYQIGQYGTLVGRSVREFPVGPTGTVESEVFPSSHLASFNLDPDAGFAPSHIRGRARWPQNGQPVDLAIAVNGIIQATTRTWTLSTNRGWDEWSAIVNEHAFRPGENDIDVFHIDADGPAVALNRTANKVLSSADGSAPIGVEPIDGVEESGFHVPQRFGDIPARWTDGHARLSIPVSLENPPKALRVDLMSTGPNGTDFQVLLEDRVLFEGRLPTGRWSSTFDLRDLNLRSRIELELISDTFIPKGTIEGNQDPRTLGVAVGGVWLLPDRMP